LLRRISPNLPEPFFIPNHSFASARALAFFLIGKELFIKRMHATLQQTQFDQHLSYSASLGGASLLPNKGRLGQERLTDTMLLQYSELFPIFLGYENAILCTFHPDYLPTEVDCGTRDNRFDLFAVCNVKRHGRRSGQLVVCAAGPFQP
jgi:hypothetical protein